jgi:hypothetical protein
MVELLASGGVRRGAESIVGRANSRSSSNKGIEGSVVVVVSEWWGAESM